MNQYFMLFINLMNAFIIYIKKDLILIARNEFYNIKFELTLDFRK